MFGVLTVYMVVFGLAMVLCGRAMLRWDWEAAGLCLAVMMAALIGISCGVQGAALGIVGTR